MTAATDHHPADEILRALSDQFDELTHLVDGLDEVGWSSPSRCEGWTLSDVVLHLAQTNDLAIASAEGRFAEVVQEFADRIVEGLAAAGITSAGECCHARVPHRRFCRAPGAGGTRADRRRGIPAMDGHNGPLARRLDRQRSELSGSVGGRRPLGADAGHDTAGRDLDPYRRHRRRTGRDLRPDADRVLELMRTYA